MIKKSQILQNGQMRFFIANAVKKWPKFSKLAMKWPGNPEPWWSGVSWALRSRWYATPVRDLKRPNLFCG